MQNSNDDTIKTSDTVLWKDIPLTLFKRVVCEKELETEQNCNILTPTLLAMTAFFSRSPGLLNRGPGDPASLGAGLLYRILSPPHLISKLVWSPNWLNFLCTELYNSSPSTFFLWVSQIALIQPVHGQGSDIPRPDAPVIYTGAFPIMTAGLGRRSICNTLQWGEIVYSFL